MPRNLWVAAQGDLCETTDVCVVYSSPTTPRICDRSTYNCGQCLNAPGASRTVECIPKVTQDICLGAWCPADSSLPPFPFPLTPTPAPTTTQAPTTTRAPVTTPIPSTASPLVTSKPPVTTAVPITDSSSSIYVGVGCGVLLLIVFSLFIVWKRRQRRVELKELETLRQEKEQEDMLHGDPALFNTIGHQSMIVSARSEPDAMWWATQAEKDEAQPPSTTHAATPHSAKASTAPTEVPV